MATPTPTKAFIESLQERTETIRYLVDWMMLDDGDTEETSQRICVLNKLNDLEMAINGIEPADLKGGEQS